MRRSAQGRFFVDVIEQKRLICGEAPTRAYHVPAEAQPNLVTGLPLGLSWDLVSPRSQCQQQV